MVHHNRRYPAARLAWFYVHARWPAPCIGHINGDPGDNRLANLREATHAQKMQNRKRHQNNTSGIPGVIWHRKSKEMASRRSASGSPEISRTLRDRRACGECRTSGASGAIWRVQSERRLNRKFECDGWISLKGPDRSDGVGRLRYRHHLSHRMSPTQFILPVVMIGPFTRRGGLGLPWMKLL
jgi:hypothetical protein